jgi:fatty acid-binding protein DegV
VDWLRSNLGALLHVRLMIELSEGIVRRLGQVRTRARAIEALAENARSWGRLERLGVLHSAAHEEAAALAGRLAPLSVAEPLIVEATTVIGAHVGPHALGLVGVLAEAGPHDDS